MSQPDGLSYQLQEIENSKIRAIRSLRTALTILRDAYDDIAAVAGLDPRPTTEIRRTRAEHWKTLGPLLLSASEDVRLLYEDFTLGEACLSGTIAKCTAILEAHEAGVSEQRIESIGLNVAERQAEEMRAKVGGRNLSNGD